jgi:hypothetical protein
MYILCDGDVYIWLWVGGVMLCDGVMAMFGDGHVYVLCWAHGVGGGVGVLLAI